jgi:hypothetical protein
MVSLVWERTNSTVRSKRRKLRGPLLDHLVLRKELQYSTNKGIAIGIVTQ